MNKGVANFAYGTYCYCLTCLFNSRRLSWMFKMDWNTGLSRTEIRALRSAPTCRLFLRSSVWRTLVCTSLRSSRAARVSLEIGILIISGNPAKTEHGPRLLLRSSTWAQIDALDAVSLLFCSRAFLCTTRSLQSTASAWQVDSLTAAFAFGNFKQQPLLRRIRPIWHSFVCYRSFQV